MPGKSLMVVFDWSGQPTCKSLYGMLVEIPPAPTATQQKRAQLSKSGMSQYPFSLRSSLTAAVCSKVYYCVMCICSHTDLLCACLHSSMLVWFTGFTLGFTLGSVNIESGCIGAGEAERFSLIRVNPQQPRCHSSPPPPPPHRHLFHKDWWHKEWKGKFSF